MLSRVTVGHTGSKSCHGVLELKCVCTSMGSPASTPPSDVPTSKAYNVSRAQASAAGPKPALPGTNAREPVTIISLKKKKKAETTETLNPSRHTKRPPARRAQSPVRVCVLLPNRGLVSLSCAVVSVFRSRCRAAKPRQVCRSKWTLHSEQGPRSARYFPHSIERTQLPS